MRTPALLVMTLAMSICALGCADYEVIENVSYDDRYGSATTLDVFLPTPPSVSRPAVVMIHGGAWRVGSKDAWDDDGARFADAGFVAFGLNYRLVPKGAYPALIQDVFCALGFIEDRADEYGVDPSRIAAIGYSAGGHLAGLLGTALPEGDFEPDCGLVPTVRPRAIISGAGPTDLTLFRDNSSTTEFLGGTKSQVPEIYERASPVNHVSSDDPPFLLIHGSDDLIVSFEHAEVMQTALEEVGVDVRLLKIRGGGHGINSSADLIDAAFVETTTDTPEAAAAILDFLDDNLGQP